jgi:hypothetical protein
MLLAHVAGVHGGWGGQYDVDEPLPSLRDVLDGRGRTPPITLEVLPGHRVTASVMIPGLAAGGTAVTRKSGCAWRRHCPRSPKAGTGSVRRCGAQTTAPTQRSVGRACATRCNAAARKLDPARANVVTHPTVGR